MATNSEKEESKPSTKTSTDGAKKTEVDLKAVLEVVSNVEKKVKTGLDNISSACVNIGSVFSESLSAAYSLLGDDFATKSQELGSQLLQGIMQIGDNDIQEIANNSIDQLSQAYEDNGLEGVATTFTEVLGNALFAIQEEIPGVLELVESLVNSVAGYIIEDSPVILEAALNIFTTVVEGLLAMIPTILDVGIQLINNLMLGMTEVLPELINSVLTIIPQIIETLTTGIPLLIDTACQLFLSLCQGLINALPSIIAEMPVIITSIVSSLLAGISSIIQCGISIFTSLTAALPEIIIQLAIAAPQIIGGIISALLQNIPNIIAAGFQLLVALVQDLPRIKLSLQAVIPAMIGSMLYTLGTFIGNMVEKGAELFRSLIADLPNIINYLQSNMPQIINGIVSALGNGVSNMGSVGLNLIQGLWNGINDATSWLYDKIAGFASGVLDKVKSIFGIHSPSKKFRWIGQMCIEGFDEPIEDYNPYDSLRESFKANKDTLAADFRGGNSMVNNNSNHQTVIIQQPVKSPSETARAIRMQEQYGLVGA